MRGRSTRVAALLAAVLLAALDQLVKQLVASKLVVGESVPVVGDWVRLTLVENTGLAFGALRGRVELPILVGAAAVVILPWLILKGRVTRAELAGVALILAGAAGNLADRLSLGYVVDFLDVGVGVWRWPAFNLADSCIVVGAVLLAIASLFGRQAGRHAVGRCRT